MGTIRVLKMVLLLQIALIAVYMSITMHIQQQYNINVNSGDVNTTNTLNKLPSLPNANCSIIWRKQNQIPMNDDVLLRFAQNNILYQYFYRKVPKGTFTYWLSHVESQNKIQEKAYFADKFLVKQYIEQMKNKFTIFNSINYARILYDFDKEIPSFETLNNLSNYQGFVIKPNHMSSAQFIIPPNSILTRDKYHKIRVNVRRWVRRKFRVSPKVEPWYNLIKPHVFIEEYINIDQDKKISNYQMIEYKINVFNYKAVFCYIILKGDFGIAHHAYVTNMYILPEFEYMNVHWGLYSSESAIISPRPSKENLNLMMKFAETFARTEGFRYVRVDMYEINKKIYFSEFTFAPMSGIGIKRPISIDYCLYDMLCDNKQEDFNKLYQYVL